MAEQIHPIDCLVNRYPQLAMPIEKNFSHSEEYKNVCLKGLPTERQPHFIKTDKDRLDTFVTPAGSVDVLFLDNREDFVHAYLALGNKCEPMEIPDSMGSCILFGLNNWEKIHGLLLPLNSIDKSCYKDELIILSGGAYSNVSAKDLGLDEDDWINKSIKIRTFHELTHFVSRKLYIENKSAIRDEIMADMIGIIYAYGKYDTELARRFLGIENGVYCQGGRLENYEYMGYSIEDKITIANQLIDAMSKELQKIDASDLFKVIMHMEENLCSRLPTG